MRRKKNFWSRDDHEEKISTKMQQSRWSVLCTVIADSYMEQTPNSPTRESQRPTSPLNAVIGPNEAPRAEVVFALAKGVAAVVAFSACLFLMVIMVFAKTFIMSSTSKYGLIPIFTLFIVAVCAISPRMDASPMMVPRIFIRCCSWRKVTKKAKTP